MPLHPQQMSSAMVSPSGTPSNYKPGGGRGENECLCSACRGTFRFFQDGAGDSSSDNDTPLLFHLVSAHSPHQAEDEEEEDFAVENCTENESYGGQERFDCDDSDVIGSGVETTGFLDMNEVRCHRPPASLGARSVSDAGSVTSFSSLQRLAGCNFSSFGGGGSGGLAMSDSSVCAKAIIDRCRSHPEEARYVNDTIRNGAGGGPPPTTSMGLAQSSPTALHYACKTGFDASVIRALMEAWPGAGYILDARGDSPLHCALLTTFGQVDSVQALLECDPNLVHAKKTDKNLTNANMLTFYSRFEREFLELIIHECTCRKKDRESSGGGTVGGDGNLHDMLSECLQKLELIVQAMHHGTVERGTTFQMLHSCLALGKSCPPLVLKLAWSVHGPRQVRQREERTERFPVHIALDADDSFLDRTKCEVWNQMLDTYPEAAAMADGRGDLPLHVAVLNAAGVEDAEDQVRDSPSGAATTPMGRREGKESETPSRTLLPHLLRHYPMAARMKNREGRLPLHLAIDAGHRWGRQASPSRNAAPLPDTDPEDSAAESELDVIGMLVEAAPQSLTSRDFHGRGLYPFVLASVCRNCSVDTLYNILRQCPELGRFDGKHQEEGEPQVPLSHPPSIHSRAARSEASLLCDGDTGEQREGGDLLGSNARSPRSSAMKFHRDGNACNDHKMPDAYKRRITPDLSVDGVRYQARPKSGS